MANDLTPHNTHTESRYVEIDRMEIRRYDRRSPMQIRIDSMSLAISATDRLSLMFDKEEGETKEQAHERRIDMLFNLAERCEEWLSEMSDEIPE